MPVPRFHPSTRGWAVVTGVMGCAISLIGITRPAPWQDEGATWIANQRSLPALWSMLRQIDAVHGVYYLLIRAWTGVFGSSILSLRVPSALAIGIAAAIVTLLASALKGPHVGPWAGVIFALLPQVTWAGAEARSYALSMAVGAAAMLAFWHATQRNTLRLWIAFTFLAALSVYLFLFLALVYLAVAVALIWLPAAVRLRAVIATGTAALLCAPIVMVSIGQTAQVSWLEKYPVTPIQVLQRTFWGQGWTGYLGSLLLAAAIINAARLFRQPGSRAAVALLLGWLVLPALALLALSLHTPLYSQRYVSASAPALALLLALLVDSLGRTWQRWLIVLVVVVVSVPPFLASRRPDAHVTAAPAAAVLAERARQGDGVYMVGKDSHALWWAFPEQLAGLTNIGLPTDVTWKETILKQPSLPVRDLAGRVTDRDRVWIFADNGNSSSAVAGFAKLGFAEVERIGVTQGSPVTLLLMERTPR